MTSQLLIGIATLFLAGCGTPQKSGFSESTTSYPAPVGAGYDDNAIARISRGETTEAQLVEWFGPPERRDAPVDGRTNLSWSFRSGTQKGAIRSGVLVVNLASDGKVAGYSARTTEPPPVHEPNNARLGYDDGAIAKISRGETTEGRLLELFGQPVSREARADRRTHLLWRFGPETRKQSDHGGVLNVSLAPDGRVDAYSAQKATD